MIVVLFIVQINKKNKRKSKINTTENSGKLLSVRRPEKTCRKYELLVSLCNDNDDDDNNHMINHY